jgi:circadian clock protein KaiC
MNTKGGGGASHLVSGEFIFEKRIRKDGEISRTINVSKYRVGNAYLGEHYFDISSNGIRVYPIIPCLDKSKNSEGIISTGDTNFDNMPGGGVRKGSVIVISGKSGIGKTNLCLQILKGNDMLGNTGIIYSFEENKESIIEKYNILFNYNPNKIIIKDLSPHKMNLGKFFTIIVEDVMKFNANIVVIDSINILYRMSFSIYEFRRVMEFLRSELARAGVTLILTYEVSHNTETFRFTGGDISYLADCIIFGRYIEIKGELVKLITVVKNRFKGHEKKIKTLVMREGEGIKIMSPFQLI